VRRSWGARRSARARRPRTRRRWWVLSAVVAVAVAGSLLAWTQPWGSSHSLASSAPAGFADPVGYHITYAVTIPGTQETTEQLWVRRPFDSVDETLAGPPPGGSLDLAIVARLGAQILHSGGGAAATLIHVAAAPAANDIHLGPILAAALSAGRLRYRGTSRVDGRPCRVYRSAQSLQTPGPLPVLGNGSSYVDTCVDDDGLPLSEASYKGARLVELRTAVAVQVGASAAAGVDYQMAGELTPFDQGGGSFNQLAPGSRPPGPSWAPSWLPAGFVAAGRYDVVPSQPQAFDLSNQGSGPPTPSGLPGALVAEIDDVYVSGPDVIVVEQGGTLNGARFAAPTGGTDVQLGPLGEGQLSLSATASVVTAEPTRGFAFVRISGTVPPALLVRIARSMRQQPPGTIVTLPALTQG
jgi:hypothetical protein